MIYTNKLLSLIRGERINIFPSEEKGKCTMVAYFPKTSVEKIARTFVVPEQIEFRMELQRSSAAYEQGQNAGPWVLFIGRPHQLEKNDSGAPPAALSTRAQAFKGDLSASPSSATDTNKSTYVIASFNNQSDASRAFNLAVVSMNTYMRRKGCDATRIRAVAPAGMSDQKATMRGQLSWPKFLLASAGMGFLMLILCAIFVSLLAGGSKQLASPAQASNAMQPMVPGKSTAIHYGPDKNDPLKSVYVFTDPSCGDCQKFQSTVLELAKNDYDVYVFPLSVMHGSAEKVGYVMCSPSKESAWTNLLKDGSVPAGANTNCSSAKAGEINQQLFDAFKFTDAPSMILGNGVIAAGYKTSDEMLALLKHP